MKSIENKIAENIVSRRKEMGLTQVELSHKAEIPQGMISEIERGKVNITISTLEKLANALDVEVSELIRESNIKNMSLKQKLEEIEKLPIDKQKVIETVLDAIIRTEI
jgi:transcriptional regulator with XRE-family HTH domain